jgi:hypothetical protein
VLIDRPRMAALFTILQTRLSKWVDRITSGLTAPLPTTDSVFDGVPILLGETIYDSVPLPLCESAYIRVIKIRLAERYRISCDFSIMNVDNRSLHNTDTTMSLPRSSQYTALSYVWGKARADHWINLNGKPFPVRKNLYDFLCEAKRAIFSEYLWIDALCIDQARVMERNHQVGLMGKIYSHAEEVIVWLGQNNELVENAMRSIDTADPFTYDSSCDSRAFRRMGMEDFCWLEYWSRAWM